ncbi:hypothetical protein PIB30_102345, partial [Stylosanthes scabra]|nr:hypothetical protein [Stylosanthes scabra]
LSEHCKTSKLGGNIAACMGEVLDCELFETGKGQERLLKATIRMDINTPFMKGTHVGSKTDGLKW